jgi:hypothetical protein
MSTKAEPTLPQGTGIRLAVQVAFIPAYAGMFLLIATAVRFFWLPDLPELGYLDALGVMAAVAAWKAVRILAAATGDGIASMRNDKDEEA